MAILFGESDAAHYAQAISATWPRHMSAVALLEATMVEGMFLYKAEIELAPVTPGHVAAARRAWWRFGKGNHRAALNFGDCFAYALTKATGEPLLLKGDDFAHADVEAA